MVRKLFLVCILIPFFLSCSKEECTKIIKTGYQLNGNYFEQQVEVPCNFPGPEPLGISQEKK